MARRNSPFACRSIRSKRRARNIALEDVRSVVAKANSSTPVGVLTGPKQSVTLAATSAMPHAADYRDVVVAYRNGAPIKLNQIARVIDSVENNKIATWFNDARAIVLAIQRQPDANTVAGRRPCAPEPAEYARPGAAIDPDAAFVRPLALHSRGGDRRAGDAGDRDYARDHGDLPVPAQSLGDHHSGARSAGVAGRHVRRDVCLRLLDQQHDAAGAHVVGRLRRRRRHRDAGKHRAPRRRRHAARSRPR